MCPQLPVFVSQIDILEFIRIRKYRLRQVRKDRHDISLIPCRLIGKLTQLVIHPQHIAVFVHDGRCDLQLFEHLCLYSPVPARKPDDGAQDARTIIEVDKQDRQKISRGKSSRRQACTVIQKVHAHRERDQGECQIQAPAPVHFQFSAVSYPSPGSHTNSNPASILEYRHSIGRKIESK